MTHATPRWRYLLLAPLVAVPLAFLLMYGSITPCGVYRKELVRDARKTAELSGAGAAEVAQADVTQMSANALLRDLTPLDCVRGYWRLKTR